MLTRETLERAGFKPFGDTPMPHQLRLVVSTAGDYDGFLDDIIYGASGYCASEDDLECGEIVLLFNELQQSLRWDFICPRTASADIAIGRLYRLPDQTADAARVLRYHLGLDLPTRTIDIGDTPELCDGRLFNAGEEIQVCFPRHDQLLGLIQTEDGAHWLQYLFDGREKRCNVLEIAGHSLNCSTQLKDYPPGTRIRIGHREFTRKAHGSFWIEESEIPGDRVSRPSCSLEWIESELGQHVVIAQRKDLPYVAQK